MKKGSIFLCLFLLAALFLFGCIDSPKATPNILIDQNRTIQNITNVIGGTGDLNAYWDKSKGDENVNEIVKTAFDTNVLGGGSVDLNGYWNKNKGDENVNAIVKAAFDSNTLGGTTDLNGYLDQAKFDENFDTALAGSVPWGDANIVSSGTWNSKAEQIDCGGQFLQSSVGVGTCATPATGATAEEVDAAIASRMPITDTNARLTNVWTAIDGNKSYLLGQNNTWTGSNTFDTLPQSGASPSNASDLVTKTYVDTAVAFGTAWKSPVLGIQATMPVGPNVGDRYVCTPTCSEVGQDNNILQWSGAAWLVPDGKTTTGFAVANTGDGKTYTYNGSAWVQIGSGLYSADAVTLLLTGSTFSIKDGGVGNTQLAGGIANSKLLKITDPNMVQLSNQDWSSTTLDSIDDVVAPAPGNGQCLVYSAGTGWVNSSCGSGGGGSGSGDNNTVVDIPIIATPQTAQTWTNQPKAVTELFANAYNRKFYDFNNVSHIRMIANVSVINTSAATASAYYPQYSLNQATWFDLNSGECDVNATTIGVHVGRWCDIAVGGQKQVYIRIVGRSSVATGDPAFRQMSLQVRVQLAGAAGGGLDQSQVDALVSGRMPIYDANQGNISATKVLGFANMFDVNYVNRFDSNFNARFKTQYDANATQRQIDTNAMIQQALDRNSFTSMPTVNLAIKTQYDANATTRQSDVNKMIQQAIDLNGWAGLSRNNVWTGTNEFKNDVNVSNKLYTGTATVSGLNNGDANFGGNAFINVGSLMIGGTRSITQTGSLGVRRGISVGINITMPPTTGDIWAGNDLNAQNNLIVGTAKNAGLSAGDVNISGKYYGNGSSLTGVPTLTANNTWTGINVFSYPGAIDVPMKIIDSSAGGSTYWLHPRAGGTANTFGIYDATKAGYLFSGTKNGITFQSLKSNADTNVAGALLGGTATRVGVGNGDINISGKYYGDGSSLTGVAGGHTQNTDTGTNQSTFTINSDSSGNGILQINSATYPMSLTQSGTAETFACGSGGTSICNTAFNGASGGYGSTITNNLATITGLSAGDMNMTGKYYGNGFSTFVGSTATTKGKFLTGSASATDISNGDVNVLGNFNGTGFINWNGRIFLHNITGATYSYLLFYDPESGEVAYSAAFTPVLFDENGKLLFEVWDFFNQGVENVGRQAVPDKQTRFTLAELKNEEAFFDYIALATRCWKGNSSSFVSETTPSGKGLESVLSRDGNYLSMSEGDKISLVFDMPKDPIGCDRVDYVFVSIGYYENFDFRQQTQQYWKDTNTILTTSG